MLPLTVNDETAGLYSLIYFQALGAESFQIQPFHYASMLNSVCLLDLIVLLLKQQKRYYILGFLTALYTAVVLNLAMEAQIIQLYLDIFIDGPPVPSSMLYLLIQNAVSASAAIIADSLLVGAF